MSNPANSRRNRPPASPVGDIATLPHQFTRHAHWRLRLREFIGWRWTVLLRPPPGVPTPAAL